MNIGIIKPIDIDQEMQTAYLDYAMSVIVARALWTQTGASAHSLRHA